MNFINGLNSSEIGRNLENIIFTIVVNFENCESPLEQEIEDPKYTLKHFIKTYNSLLEDNDLISYEEAEKIWSQSYKIAYDEVCPYANSESYTYLCDTNLPKDSYSTEFISRMARSLALLDAQAYKNMVHWAQNYISSKGN